MAHTPETPIMLQLSRADLFMILDALESRADSYENTSAILDDSIQDKPFDMIIEDVRDQDEATEIASDFRAVIHTINQQMNNADQR